MPGWLREISDGVALTCKIRPGAGRDAVVRADSGWLQVHIQAPAIDNKANQALVRFLAKVLSVSRSRVTLLKGRTSRLKIIHVAGLDAAGVLKQLTMLHP